MSNPDLDIPDIGAEVEDAIDVLPRCTIAELSVDIYIMHTYRGDLVVELAAPNRVFAQLKSFDGGDSGDDLVGNYPASLEPDDSLSLFAELEARGSWTLGVRDVGQNDVGTLRNWTLNLTCL